jgi:hypothetical protein
MGEGLDRLVSLAHLISLQDASEIERTASDREIVATDDREARISR